MPFEESHSGLHRRPELDCTTWCDQAAEVEQTIPSRPDRYAYIVLQRSVPTTPGVTGRQIDQTEFSMHSKRTLALAAFVATTHAANGINQAATQLIQGYEKFMARPYNDGYGYWTVGYGHRVCGFRSAMLTF